MLNRPSISVPPALLPTAAAPAVLSYDEQRYFAVGPSVRQRLRARFGFHARVILSLPPKLDRPVDLLLGAFALVARRDSLARLFLPIIDREPTGAVRRWVAGRRGEVERSALLRGRVCFAPVVGEADKPDLYRAADIFACAADDEAAEISALEAMASGVPAVLSIRGQLQRAFAFGRHALHADPHDPVDFGLTLAKLFRHAQLRVRLARMGAHQARSLFTSTARACAHAAITHLDLPPEPFQASA
jgi:mannosylfructose-phosphate synthase